MSTGCDFVYTAHADARPAKPQQNFQFRFSFSRAAVILLNSWSPEQQFVHHMLRFLLKRELWDTTKPTTELQPSVDEAVCSYHIQTLMLWACEEKPAAWWNPSSLVAVCSELLNTLSH